MKSYLASVLMLAVVCTGVAASSAPQRDPHGQRPPHDARQQDSHRWKWWMNPSDRQDLGITDEQSAAIEEIFESTMPGHRARWREFEQLAAALEKTLQESTADVTAVARQVEKVEKMRAELAKTRTLMLYRMNQVLTPEQRVKVDQLRAKREQERRRQPDKNDHAR